MVFDLVDQALDFVMSKIARRVGTRACPSAKQGRPVSVKWAINRTSYVKTHVLDSHHRWRHLALGVLFPGEALRPAPFARC